MYFISNINNLIPYLLKLKLINSRHKNGPHQRRVNVGIVLGTDLDVDMEVRALTLSRRDRRLIKEPNSPTKCDQIRHLPLLICKFHSWFRPTTGLWIAYFDISKSDNWEMAQVKLCSERENVQMNIGNRPCWLTPFIFGLTCWIFAWPPSMIVFAQVTKWTHLLYRYQFG